MKQLPNKNRLWFLLSTLFLVTVLLIAACSTPFAGPGSPTPLSTPWVLAAHIGQVTATPLPTALPTTAPQPTVAVDWSSGVSPASAILIDVDTGQELYTYLPELPWVPASLTKLVTAYVVLDAAAHGEVDLDAPLPVPEEAWAENQPADSSLMYLGSDQEISTRELLRGLLIVSGNDAAVALAVRVSGSVDAFVQRMNDTVRQMGFTNMHFVDPAGYSDENQITAREYAYFALHYMQQWPDALAQYNGQPSMVVPDGSTLENKNDLVRDYPGCDGLKTGYLDISGYNLAATAQQGGRRMLVVLLGIQPPDGVAGSQLREEMGTQMLDWGFGR